MHFSEELFLVAFCPQTTHTVLWKFTGLLVHVTPPPVSFPFCIYLFCANRGYGSEASHMLHFSHCFPLRALVCLWSVAEKKLHITKRVTTRLRISLMSKESIGVGTAWEQCVPDELPDVFLVKKCGAVKKCVGLCVFWFLFCGVAMPIVAVYLVNK